MDSSDNSLFEKIFQYQEDICKNSFSFLRTSIIYYMINSSSNEIFSEDLDQSCKVFLQFFVISEKSRCEENKFLKSLSAFYRMNKNKILNILPTSNELDSSVLYGYFVFYLHYLNILFLADIKLIEILINQKEHWVIRYRSLKLLEEFLKFEKDQTIFKVSLFIYLIALQYRSFDFSTE